MKYSSLTLLFKKKFFNLVSTSKNILIVGHTSPDDDAVSSVLSLKYFLSQKYSQKKIVAAFSAGPVDRFFPFAGYPEIKFVKDITHIIDDYDTVFFLDGSQYSRFSNNPSKISAAVVKKICIDHHASPTDKFDLHLQKPSASSTAELIYQLIDKKIILDVPLCELLLLGILGDTGTFNYIKPGQYHIFSIVKKILEASHIEIQEFKSRYSLISQPVFLIIQEFIRNTKFIDLEQNSYQYTYLTREFIKRNHYSDGQTSEAAHIYMSNYLRLIENYRWGFIATPRQNEISVSFRSLPKSVNVRNVVERIGIGGGHDRASGSEFKIEKWGKGLNLNFVIKYLIDWIAVNKLELS